MGLFDRKYCDICGNKIGLLGNRKLENGNMCKDCAAKLSPWMTGRKQMTVEDILAHLQYRADNARVLEMFQETRVVGRNMQVHIDDVHGWLFFTRSNNWRNENPDVLRFDQITGADYQIHEYEHRTAVEVEDMAPPPEPGPADPFAPDPMYPEGYEQVPPPRPTRDVGRPAPPPPRPSRDVGRPAPPPPRAAGRLAPPPPRPAERTAPPPPRPAERTAPPPPRPAGRPAPPPPRPAGRPAPPPPRPTRDVGRPAPPPPRAAGRPAPPPPRPAERTAPPPPRPAGRPAPPPPRPAGGAANHPGQPPRRPAGEAGRTTSAQKKPGQNRQERPGKPGPGRP